MKKFLTDIPYTEVITDIIQPIRKGNAIGGILGGNNIFSGDMLMGGSRDPINEINLNQPITEDFQTLNMTSDPLDRMSRKVSIDDPFADHSQMDKDMDNEWRNFRMNQMNIARQFAECRF